MKKNGIVGFLALASGLISCFGEIEWKASDGVLPSDSGAGFVQVDPQGGCISLKDGALLIDTNDDQSAWIELPVTLPEAGTPFSVEIEADSNASPDASGIQIASGTSGVFAWLFDKKHLRVTTDSSDNTQYYDVDVTKRHSYLFEIDGQSVSISVDHHQVFHGSIEEPLSDFKLAIGDQSPGGGKTRIYHVKVSWQEKKTSLAPALEPKSEKKAWVTWKKSAPETGLRSSEIAELWPPKADALVLAATYRAASPRQGQIYVLSAGPSGKEVSSVATSLSCISDDESREERFFIRIPPKTETIRVVWEAAPSVVPFTMKSLELRPVTILASNSVLQRTSGLAETSVGQTFHIRDPSNFEGVAIPLSRSFEAAANLSRLKCRVTGGGKIRAESEVSADQVPREFFGTAIFLNAAPIPVEGDLQFSVESGIREPRFFGWYQYQISTENPYQSGQMLDGDRAEQDTDMTFYAFAGVQAK